MSTPHALSPELALAAACALVDDQRLTQLLDHLLADRAIEWDRMLSMATYHGIEHVMHSRVESLRPGVMPASVRKELHARLRGAVALQAAQTRAACRVVQALDRGGVPAIVIKGAGVGHLLYAPHPEFRGSYDVDVVVAPQDLPAAEWLLGELGFELAWPAFEVSERLRPMLLKLANVFDFRDPRLDTTIELHARPTTNPHAFPVPFAELLDASIPVDTAEGPLRTLDGPINVAYLCHHALDSWVFRLKWFGDIARAEQRAGLPCDRYVAESAVSLPVEHARFTAQVLRRLEDEIAAQTAGTALRARPGRALGRVLASMEALTDISTERTVSRLPVDLADLLLKQALQPNLLAKAYNLLLFASDPRDVVTLRLGTRFAVLYGFAGPLLALSRYLRRKVAQPRAGRGAVLAGES